MNIRWVKCLRMPSGGMHGTFLLGKWEYTWAYSTQISEVDLFRRDLAGGRWVKLKNEDHPELVFMIMTRAQEGGP